LTINPEKIIISAQSDANEPFKRDIEYLFKSLNLFGGSLAHSQKIACLPKSVDDDLVKMLNELGVRIKIIEDVDERDVYARKIKMLELDENEHYDYLVSLDADVVIANDFSHFIEEEGVGAKPVDMDPLTMLQWKELFEYFRIEFPQERYLTSFTQVQTIPYFNIGVLIIPRKYVSKIYQSWKDIVPKMIDAYEDLPFLAKYPVFTIQFAFSLVLAETKTPHYSLPLEMNFPTHQDIHHNLKPEKLNPFIIHHHHRIFESGEIMPCSYENINKLIEKINQLMVLSD